jgi:AcrR family transcriptional regulator
MKASRPRSADTRQRIVEAAQRLFAEEGYERTTIRGVAAAASIDPSMVMRYFESKEGLFAAAASMDLQLPDIAAMPREEIGERLVRHFLSLWREYENRELNLLLRSASTNEEAREKMRELLRTQIQPVIESVVSNPEEVLLRSALVGSQIVGLAFCRYVLVTPILAGDDDELIVRHVGPVIQMYLFGNPAS